MNKKILFTVFYFITAVCITFSQEVTMQNLEGIWLQGDESDNVIRININKTGKKLIFAYESGKGANNVYIAEFYYGFQDVYELDKQYTMINVEDLKTSGKYYTEIDVSDVNKNGFTNFFSTPGIAFNGESDLLINTTRPLEFEKLNSLPTPALKLLYLQGKKDNRDYLKEYLNLDIKEIIVPQSIIYSEPNKPTKMYLVKEDIVTVLDENKKWIKIEYYNDNNEQKIEGWIKTETTE